MLTWVLILNTKSPVCSSLSSINPRSLMRSIPALYFVSFSLILGFSCRHRHLRNPAWTLTLLKVLYLSSEEFSTMFLRIVVTSSTAESYLPSLFLDVSLYNAVSTTFTYYSLILKAVNLTLSLKVISSKLDRSWFFTVGTTIFLSWHWFFLR